MEKKCKIYYCKKYMDLAMTLCRKSPNNNDDWDELEDPCLNCGYWKPMEVDVDTFTVKCIKDRYGMKAGDEVEAYVNGGMLVVGGYITSLKEFKEYFEQ